MAELQAKIKELEAKLEAQRQEFSEVYERLLYLERLTDIEREHRHEFESVFNRNEEEGWW